MRGSRLKLTGRLCGVGAALALLSACSLVQEVAVPIAQGDFYPGQLAARAADSDIAAPSPTTPLLILRFANGEPDYRSALQSTVGAALQQHPTARVAVVSLTPTEGDAAENLRRAQDRALQIARELTALGVPIERISIAVATSDALVLDEVELYLH